MARSPSRPRSVAAEGRRFFLLVGALALALLVTGGLRLWVTSGVYDPAVEQGVLFARAVTDGHEAMLDQETGLRGYQMTGEPSYLGPYRSGQLRHQQASARAWRLVSTAELEQELTLVDRLAGAWHTQHAVPQIALTAPGRADPPDAPSTRQGKRQFDAYRAAYEHLLLSARARNNQLLHEGAALDRVFSLVELLLAGAAVVLAALRRKRLTEDLVRPVQEVTAVLHRLADGEETARPVAYPVQEFDALSSGVGALARSAQQRREEADDERGRAAAQVRVYEQVLGVAHELGGYLDPEELGGALLRAVRAVAKVDSAVLLSVRDGRTVGALAGTAGDEDRAGPLAQEALRFLRLALSEDGCSCAVPVVHGGTVHALLQLSGVAPLDEQQLLAVRNLVLAAGGALTAARLHEQVHAESRSDALTGLHNRRRFEEDLSHELGLAARMRVPVSLVLLDVDHFKRFNDTHGHRAGDRLLHDLSSLLTVSLRSTDSAYRYGGEELAVLLRGSPADEAERLAERVRATVEARTGVTVSVGVVTVTDDLGPDAVVEAADRALYEAKAGGRNTVRTGHATGPARVIPAQRAG